MTKKPQADSVHKAAVRSMQHWLNTGRSACPLTGREITDDDYAIYFGRLSKYADHPLAEYAELHILREAFEVWEHKKEFLQLWRDSVADSARMPEWNILVDQTDYLVLKNSLSTIVLLFCDHGFQISMKEHTWSMFEEFLLQSPQYPENTFDVLNGRLTIQVKREQIRIDRLPRSLPGFKDGILLNQSEWEALKKVVRKVNRALGKSTTNRAKCPVYGAAPDKSSFLLRSTWKEVFSMNPIAFMKTIYLGDRACKKIVLDSWNNRVMIQVDCISRIRDSSGQWNFYTAEDIPDAFIVLSQVEFFAMEPPGFMPNDQIDVEVEPLSEKNSSGNPVYLFTFYIGYGGQDPKKYQTVEVKVKACSVYLEDPSRPGIQITD